MNQNFLRFGSSLLLLAVLLMVGVLTFGCAQQPITVQQQQAGDTVCGIVQDIQDVLNTPDLLTKDELAKLSDSVPIVSMVCKDDGTFQAVDLQNLVSVGLPLIQDRIIARSSLSPQGKALASVSLKIIERRVLRLIKQRTVVSVPAA